MDKIRQGNSYREWSKSKGPGKGRRYFAAPCPELKKVQNAILQRFLKSIPVHFCRHGNQEECLKEFGDLLVTVVKNLR